MSELRFYKKKKRINYNLLRGIVVWTFNIVLVIVVAYFLVSFFGRRVSMIGESMTPLLENGDHVLVNKVSYMFGAPKRNDIIVFKPNGNENAHSYIRRVVGTPGETILIEDGQIYIDGDVLEEDIEVSAILEGGIAKEEYQLGGDEYFVLCDNRISTDDSRNADIGPVKRKHIEGKAWYIVTPKEKRGFISARN